MLSTKHKEFRMYNSALTIQLLASTKDSHKLSMLLEKLTTDTLFSWRSRGCCTSSDPISTQQLIQTSQLALFSCPSHTNAHIHLRRGERATHTHTHSNRRNQTCKAWHMIMDCNIRNVVLHSLGKIGCDNQC